MERDTTLDRFFERLEEDRMMRKEFIAFAARFGFIFPPNDTPSRYDPNEHKITQGKPDIKPGSPMDRDQPAEPKSGPSRALSDPWTPKVYLVGADGQARTFLRVKGGTAVRLLVVGPPGEHVRIVVRRWIPADLHYRPQPTRSSPSLRACRASSPLTSPKRRSGRA